MGDGLRSRNSGESLASIRESVERLSRLVETSLKKNIQSGLSSNDADAALRHPGDIVRDGLMKMDPQLIAAGLPRLYELSGPIMPVIIAATVLVNGGYPEGAHVTRSILEAIADGQLAISPDEDAPLNADAVEVMLGGLYEFYRKMEASAQILPFYVSVADKFATQPDIPSDVVAYVQNRVGMLAYGVGDEEMSLEWSRRAAETNPNEAAYYYNWGLSLVHLERHEEALPVMKKLISIADAGLSPSHVRLCETVFKAVGDDEALRLLHERFGVPQQEEPGDSLPWERLQQAFGVNFADSEGSARAEPEG